MGRDIVKVIYQISQKIMSITDDELKEMQEMIDAQKKYIHPLKCATQAYFNDIGEHNQKVIDLIKALRDVLLSDMELYNDNK